MHVTIATIVRDEADRFLPSALEAWKQFSDRIVVLDDGSTDSTVAICNEAGAEVHCQEPCMWGNEWGSRRKLWHLATRDAEWVLWLDADQVMSIDPRPHLKPPVSLFRVYDLWGEDCYREDAWWTGHLSCWWHAVHVPSLPDDYQDRWNERGVHCGHVPNNLPGPMHPTPIDCAVLHYAFSTPELRERKLAMYEAVSAQLTGSERFHARSIAAPNPPTRPLPFEPSWRLRISARR